MLDDYIDKYLAINAKRLRIHVKLFIDHSLLVNIFRDRQANTCPLRNDTGGDCLHSLLHDDRSSSIS